MQAASHTHTGNLLYNMSTTLQVSAFIVMTRTLTWSRDVFVPIMSSDGGGLLDTHTHIHTNTQTHIAARSGNEWRITYAHFDNDLPRRRQTGRQSARRALIARLSQRVDIAAPLARSGWKLITEHQLMAPKWMVDINGCSLRHVTYERLSMCWRIQPFGKRLLIRYISSPRLGHVIALHCRYSFRRRLQRTAATSTSIQWRRYIGVMRFHADRCSSVYF